MLSSWKAWSIWLFLLALVLSALPGHLANGQEDVGWMREGTWLFVHGKAGDASDWNHVTDLIKNPPYSVPAENIYMPSLPNDVMLYQWTTNLVNWMNGAGMLSLSDGSIRVLTHSVGSAVVLYLLRATYELQFGNINALASDIWDPDSSTSACTAFVSWSPNRTACEEIADGLRALDADPINALKWKEAAKKIGGVYVYHPAIRGGVCACPGGWSETWAAALICALGTVDDYLWFPISTLTWNGGKKVVNIYGFGGNGVGCTNSICTLPLCWNECTGAHDKWVRDEHQRLLPGDDGDTGTRVLGTYTELFGGYCCHSDFINNEHNAAQDLLIKIAENPTPINHSPIADAGDDQMVPDCSIVDLDGSGSYDPDNDSLSYHWQFIFTPGAVEPPELSDPYAVNPTFYVAYDEKAGGYVLELTVTDVWGEDTDQVTVTIVPRAPTSLIAEPLSETEIKLTWNDNSVIETGYEIWMRPGDGTYDDVDNPIGTTGPAEGSYLVQGLEPWTTYCFKVRAVADGVFSDFTPEECAKTLDETPPIVTIEGAPEDWQNEDATAYIHCEDNGGSGCDPDSYRLKIYDHDPVTCPTPTTDEEYYEYYDKESPLTISQHCWVCGGACDNADPPNCSYSDPVEFKVDEIPPDPPTDVRSPSHKISVWSSDNTIDMKWDEATDEGGSGVHGYEYWWLRPNESPPIRTAPPVVPPGEGTTSPPLDDGYWWFWIRTVDNAGNRSSFVPPVGPFHIDTTPPEAPTLISPSNGSFINDNTPFFDWSDVTDLSGVTYELRVWHIVCDPKGICVNVEDIHETNLEASEYQFPELIKPLPDETYSWNVRAIDAADNQGSPSETWTFTIDTASPEIELTRPEQGERLEIGEDYSIGWNATDSVGVDHVDILISRGLEVLLKETVSGDVSTYTWTVPPKPSDDCEIIVIAYDAAGNHSSDKVKFSICWLTSTDEEATALNNGRKLVRDSQGNLHLVFSSNYTVYYSMSVDEGESWIRKVDLGLGRYPAISLDSEGSPCVVWATPATAAPIAGSGIYFSRRIGGDQTHPYWTKPINVLSAKAPSQPSFVVDESGNGYVVTVDIKTTEVIYREFNIWVSESAPECVALDKYAYGRASIAIDPQANTIHVVWDSKKGEIYYSTKEGGNWSPPEEISSETLGTSRSPFIDCYKGSVRVVWEQWEEVEKNWEIFGRAKWIDGDWGEVENVSETEGVSTSPQIVDGSVVMWQEQGKTDEQIQLAAEIYYKVWNEVGWTDAQNLSNTSQNSAYPQIALKKDGSAGFLYCVWTEGGPLVTPSYRYEVKFGSAPVTLSRPRPRQPDLVVEDLKVSKESVQLQEEVGIEAKVTNQGCAKAGRCLISFRVDGKEFDRRPVPELGPRMSAVVSTSWKAASPGKHTISAFVDVDNQVKESQEGNNERSRSIWVIALPDLTVIEFSLSTEAPEAGESVVISALIANIGEVSTEARTEVVFQVDGKEFYREEIQPLGPGSKKEIRSRWIAEGGVHTIEVVVDPKDRIREENERNNKRSIQIEVKVNRPPIANPDGPYKGYVGEPIKFDGSGSYDPDGRIAEYRWDFGDGYTAEGVSVTHTYKREGEYEVCLTVRDDDGATNVDCTRAYIEEKLLPDLTIHWLRVEPREPIEGQEVRIEALVLNNGSAAAKNALVLLLIDGRKFAENTIRQLLPNEGRTLEFRWKATEGWHTITVVADPYNEIEESNEENNKKEEKIQVKPKPKQQGSNFPNASRISFVGNSNDIDPISGCSLRSYGLRPREFIKYRLRSVQRLEVEQRGEASPASNLLLDSSSSDF